jgi:hypothetical protein
VGTSVSEEYTVFMKMEATFTSETLFTMYQTSGAINHKILVTTV